MKQGIKAKTFWGDKVLIVDFIAIGINVNAICINSNNTFSIFSVNQLQLDEEAGEQIV